MVVGRLVFDFARHSVEKTIRVKQFDSETRNLLVVLLNDGEPYEMPEGAIVRIECRKSDGEEILNDCTYVENLITAEITEQMTAAAGYAECAISVYEKESYIASWTFNIKVDTAVIVGDKIASTIEYKAIINALQEVEKSKDTVEEAAQSLYEAGVKHVVIKGGGRGCYLRSSDERGWIPAVTGGKWVDTTGAGDSFAAGFVCALSEGRSFRECAQFANECGAKAVGSVGAVEWTG